MHIVAMILQPCRVSNPHGKKGGRCIYQPGPDAAVGSPGAEDDHYASLPMGRRFTAKEAGVCGTGDGDGRALGAGLARLDAALRAAHVGQPRRISKSAHIAQRPVPGTGGGVLLRRAVCVLLEKGR